MIFSNKIIKNKIEKIDSKDMTSLEIKNNIQINKIVELPERKLASASNIERLSKHLKEFGAITPIRLLRDNTKDDDVYILVDGYLRLNACNDYIFHDALDVNFLVEFYYSELKPAEVYTFFNLQYSSFQTVFFEYAQQEKLQLDNTSLTTETIALEKLDEDKINKIRDLIDLQCPTCNITFDAFEPTKKTEPAQRKIKVPAQARTI